MGIGHRLEQILHVPETEMGQLLAIQVPTQPIGCLTRPDTCPSLVNSLPNHAVDVNSVNLFKARLDRFWMDQDVKYDFTADLTGTGDRSVNVISET